MIKITDWIAAIPEEDKRIAFVGEGDSVVRDFLFTDPAYFDWTFHLDMHFDLSTVTTVGTKSVETTTVDEEGSKDETESSAHNVTVKEQEDQTNITVNCNSTTDIAYLTKSSAEGGIRLRWTVSEQQTQLPGKLLANIRAVGPNDEIKKSAMMVFEVAPAVIATPAAPVSRSEFEEMEEAMDTLVTEAEGFERLTKSWAIGGTGARAGEDTNNSKYYAEQAASGASLAHNLAIEAESYAMGGTGQRQGEDTDNAKYYAEQAEDYAEQAAESVVDAIISENAAGTDSGNDFKLANSGGKITVEGTEVIIGKHTGDVTVKGNAQMEAGYQPLYDLNLATKKYVDAHAGGTWESEKTEAADTGNDTLIINETGELEITAYRGVIVESPTGVMLDSPVITLEGDTAVNGAITIPEPTGNTNPATKKYADDMAAAIKVYIDERTNTVKTSINDPCTVNTAYFLGQKASLTVNLPTTASAGNEVLVVFSSGNTPCLLTVNLTGFDFTPKANKTCHIRFTYTGTDWLVETKEG